MLRKFPGFKLAFPKAFGEFRDYWRIFRSEAESSLAPGEPSEDVRRVVSPMVACIAEIGFLMKDIKSY